MLRRISGIVIEKNDESVVIDVHGVGYLVHMTPDGLMGVTENENTSLHTFLAVRENAQDLYGFLSARDLCAFELLLSVSGIGPKSALNVLSHVTTDTLASAVREQKSSYLSSVAGVGKKTAEKVVLELKDRHHLFGGIASAAPTGDEEALEALKTMGYSKEEARTALRTVPSSVEGGSARLRAALKQLGS